ncbi:hypothetical protein IWX92DRAFT_372924 [Phyllosticta citricarpa]
MQCCSAGTITHICLAGLAWVDGSCCALACGAKLTRPSFFLHVRRFVQDDLPTSSNSVLDDGNARQTGPPENCTMPELPPVIAPLAHGPAGIP